MSDTKSGWGWPVYSKKAHYFVDGRSLCGKWLYLGSLEQGNDDSRDNCAECKKRLKRVDKPITVV